MMENISKHITYKEAVKSREAVRRGILNKPTEQELINMKKAAQEMFEPLRDFMGGWPIWVSSFYRCIELNDVLGGVPSSQHLAMYGAAMDLDNDPFPDYRQNDEIFYGLLKLLNFDQLIWEFGDYPGDDIMSIPPRPAWVHVSYVSLRKNRNEVWFSYFDRKPNGKDRVKKYAKFPYRLYSNIEKYFPG